MEMTFGYGLGNMPAGGIGRFLQPVQRYAEGGAVEKKQPLQAGHVYDIGLRERFPEYANFLGGDEATVMVMGGSHPQQEAPREVLRVLSGGMRRDFSPGDPMFKHFVDMYQAQTGKSLNFGPLPTYSSNGLTPEALAKNFYADAYRGPDLSGIMSSVSNPANIGIDPALMYGYKVHHYAQGGAVEEKPPLQAGHVYDSGLRERFPEYANFQGADEATVLVLGGPHPQQEAPREVLRVLSGLNRRDFGVGDPMFKHFVDMYQAQTGKSLNFGPLPTYSSNGLTPEALAKNFYADAYRGPDLSGIMSSVSNPANIGIDPALMYGYKV